MAEWGFILFKQPKGTALVQNWQRIFLQKEIRLTNQKDLLGTHMDQVGL